MFRPPGSTCVVVEGARRPTRCLRPGSVAARCSSRSCLAGAAGPAHAQAGSKCSSLKLKAAGAYFKAQASCRAKSVAKGQPSNAACLVAASDQLARALAKAERRGDCLTLEGDLPVSTTLKDAGDEVSQILAPTCCRLDTTCTWLSEDRCLLQTATPGAPGTVCSGTGECTPPPAASGDCCELNDVLGTAGQSCLAHLS